MSRSGYLSVCVGPMFSGKSSMLIRLVRKYRVLGKQLCIVKPAMDGRYASDHVVSHDEDREPCISVQSLRNLRAPPYTDALDRCDVLLIEEAQFFDDLLSGVQAFVNDMHKRVYVFGLSGDSSRMPFGQVLDLIPMADDIVHCKAFCKRCGDGTEAPFSRRITSESTSQVLVGGSEAFESVCRAHYSSM